MYVAQGQYALAEPLYKRSLTIWEKALGPDHPRCGREPEQPRVLYKSQGQYAQAEPLYKRSLAILEKALGPDHPSVATGLNNLALIVRRPRPVAAQAEPLCKRSLAIWEKALGPNHPSVATALENLAALYRKTDRLKEAESLEQRAAAIRAIKR